MVVEKNDDYIMRAKTGLGNKRDGIYTGWYIGYVETSDNIYAFALNMDEADYDKIKTDVRVELTKNILRELDILK